MALMWRREPLLVRKKLLDAMARPFHIGDRDFRVSASIGISCYPTDGGDISTLLKNADTAMYCAKNRGRNAYQFFSLKRCVVANRPDPEP